jgi:hypothetical protein
MHYVFVIPNPESARPNSSPPACAALLLPISLTITVRILCGLSGGKEEVYSILRGDEQ